MLVSCCPNIPITHIHSLSTRTLLGSIFLHLAIESSFPQIRRVTLSTLERLAATLPEHLNLATLSAASAFLSRDKTPSKPVAGDEPDNSGAKEGRLPAFILACAAFADDCPSDIKERLLWDWVIVAHHPGPCEHYSSNLVIRIQLIRVNSGERAPGLD